MNEKIAMLLEEIESNGESAAAVLADHLRTVAENGSEYAETEALREEAETLIEWAAYFLCKTGGIPTRLRAEMCEPRADIAPDCRA